MTELFVRYKSSPLEKQDSLIHPRNVIKDTRYLDLCSKSLYPWNYILPKIHAQNVNALPIQDKIFIKTDRSRPHQN